MADNFDLKQFLTENNLTKNAQLLKEEQEGFTPPVQPLRIWNKNNADESKNKACYISVVGGLADNKEVSFSEEEIIALHKLIDEWFNSQQSGFNRTISVNTKDKNFTQATVGIKKLKDFDVEIFRIETTAGMSQYRGYGDEMGGGICIIKVANMYQLKDDKNLYEADWRNNPFTPHNFDGVAREAKKHEHLMAIANKLFPQYGGELENFKPLSQEERSQVISQYTDEVRVVPVKETVKENTMTNRERRLVEMVQDAMREEEEVGPDGLPTRKADPGDPNFDPTDIPPPPKELNIVVQEDEMVQDKPLPKYESIEELMKEIEHGTNQAAHKYKMDEMKRVYEALEAKVGSLEEGEHAEHIDQKAVKQMRKDIAALRKAEEKLRKEFEKKFTGKEKKETPKKDKEVVALQEGTFDLRKFLAENKLTAGSRILNEVLQQMEWKDVGPKLLPIAQKYNLFTIQQPMDRSQFIAKVKSLNNDFSQVGQGMVGVMANVSGAGGVDILVYSSEKVDTLKSFSSELKKQFPTITDNGNNEGEGSYLQISNFSQDT